MYLSAVLLDLLLHEESVDGLLLPDELDNQSVQVDKQSPTKTTGNTVDTHTHWMSWRYCSTWDKNAFWVIILKLHGLNGSIRMFLSQICW